jgi:hypothetical protein
MRVISHHSHSFTTSFLKLIVRNIETTFHLPAEFSAQGLPEYLQQSEGPGWATAEGADGQIYRATKRNKKHKKEKNQGSYAPGVTSVQLRFHSSVSKHGNFPPPDVFYAGVVFGITWENSHALEVNDGEQLIT